ncbi:MAG: MBL fold metallo-hydrolase [Gemmatimonadetes bacterium]|nr:MBL fold metallo-hydrolase [Gemmatimonadota bacterium]
MLTVISHGDVTRLRCSSRMSRAMNYEVSAYLVRGVLVDTGFPAMGGDLSAWLAGVRPEGALVTHHHEDHAGNVGRLAALGVPVGLAPLTLERIVHPEPIGWYRRLCWGSARPLAVQPAPYEHPALTLIHTPGHSADHHVVWDAERETVFGGDLFLGVKVRIAHPGEDIRGQVAVLRRVAALAPRRFFDAHRGAIERPVEMLLAKAQWIEEVVGRIERRAAEGWTARAIEAEVLGAGDFTGLISRGDYAKRNIVESVLAGIGRGVSDAGKSTNATAAQ